MKKGFIIFILAIVVLLSMTCSVFAWVVPSHVKIGLYFEKTAVTSIEIESETGFQIGYESNNQFYGFFNKPDVKKYLVRKDSYYADSGSGVVEYNPGASDIPAGAKYGPYHVQIGPGYGSYEEVMQQVNMLNQYGIKPFPAVINGLFYVWTGCYASAEEANNAMVQAQAALGGPACTVIEPSSTRIQALAEGTDIGFIFDDRINYLNMQPMETAAVPIIYIHKKPYRGGVEFKRLNGSDMTVINRVELEQYLYAVLPREMGADWPMEALKAQAVAARTYTVLNMDKYKKYGFNLCDTTLSQVYGGYRSEQPACTQAVEETRGKILTYEGKPANVYYFSSSGGHTEDVKNVWGSSIPYLKGVEDPYEPTEKSGKGFWTVEMAPQQISEALKAKGYNVGDVLSVSAIEYSEAGSVIKLKICGTSGEVILEREEPRKVFGFNVLNSQKFTVITDSSFYIINSNGESPVAASGSQLKLLSASGISSSNVLSNQIVVKGADADKCYPMVPQKFIFQGKGWGHSVGMSQWGARGMAEAGFTYEQILTHYFTGTKVE